MHERGESMTITTKAGFTCDIDPSALDDMELLELIGEIQDGNTYYVPKVMTRMLGNDQKKKLYDFIRTDSGRVPTGAAFDLMGEIFDAINEAKETKN